MSEQQKDLGRLVAIHPIAPIYIQRAIFIAVLSFLFFLGTMTGFYLRQNVIYFLLATAFLLVYLVTMFSWFTQRKSVVKVYERGIEYKARSLEWSDIASVTSEKPVLITPKSGKVFELPSTISEPVALARNIRFHVESMDRS